MTSPGMLHRERLRQGVEGEIPPRYDDANILTRQLFPLRTCSITIDGVEKDSRTTSDRTPTVFCAG